MNPFQSLRDYEEFVYTLQQRFPSIKSSNLVVIRRGKRVATLQGELTFAHGYRLAIRERLSYDAETVVIESYGYELWHNAEKLGWYAPQPHPEVPGLVSTFPHHKHVPPNIKHNRIPAPMSFTCPNLPILIQEVEERIPKVEI
ncbi:hypothetical protein HYR99_05175 [Candidatus Poribacteria bacterium]|nr:hypothetical protein [Candidatus Poribacteria bacterium]